MKKLTLTTLALMAAGSTTALAQETRTIDQAVNETFATITGPFVNFIFYRFPAPAFRGL